MMKNSFDVSKINLNWTAALSGLSVVMLLLLSIGGFVLSYSALYEVALANGLGSSLSYIWPLLIDAAIIIFSLSVLRSTLLGDSAKWPWVLVGVFTFWTIVFNLVHADEATTHIDLYLVQLPLRYLVAMIPPVALVLAFETLVSQLKNGIKRKSITESLTKLTIRRDKTLAELRQIEAENQTKKQVLADNLRQYQAEIETKTAGLNDNLRQLEDIYQDKKASLQAELAELAGQIQTKRKELSDIDRKPIVIAGDIDPAKMKPADRQPVIKQLLADNVPEDEILNLFDISAKTLSRDIAAIESMNGHHP